MVEGILALWYVLTAGSLIFVIWDQLTNTPSMRIMTWAWALIVLYTGPIGLFIYFLSCRQPMPDTHDAFIKPLWKQAIGSTIHCVAGDATAIILMALLLSFFSPPNGWELVLEYVVAYLFGLFIFQAVFMRQMFASYKKAVISTIFAETVSMNMVMIGMFPSMLILRHVFSGSLDPFNARFWGVLSAATIFGFIVAYPINYFMVKRGIKHGMMSKNMTMHMEHHHEPLSSKLQWILVIVTFALLIGALFITNIFVPIVFD